MIMYENKRMICEGLNLNTTYHFADSTLHWNLVPFNFAFRTWRHRLILIYWTSWIISPLGFWLSSLEPWSRHEDLIWAMAMITHLDLGKNVLPWFKWRGQFLCAFAGCEVHVRAILDLKARDLVGSVGILLLFIREAAREFWRHGIVATVFYPLKLSSHPWCKNDELPPVDCNHLIFSRLGFGRFNQIDLVDMTIKQSIV